MDLYRGKLSPRKAQVLAFMLPPGSLTWQEVGTDGAWTTTDFLLADVVDLLALANYQRGGAKGPKPDPVPRPKDLKELRDKREAVAQKAAAFRERLKRRTSEERG